MSTSLPVPIKVPVPVRVWKCRLTVRLSLSVSVRLPVLVWPSVSWLVTYHCANLNPNANPNREVGLQLLPPSLRQGEPKLCFIRKPVCVCVCVCVRACVCARVHVRLHVSVYVVGECSRCVCSLCVHTLRASVLFSCIHSVRVCVYFI